MDGGRPIRRRFAVELLAVLAFLAVIVLLRGYGLRLDGRALRHTLVPMLPVLPRILLAGLALGALGVALSRQSVRVYLRDFFRLPSLETWLRLGASFVLAATFAYAWLKVCVPLLNPRLWDAEVWRFERWLHFGISPNVLVLELFRGAGWLRAIDAWYAFWLVTVFLGWSWGLAMPGLARRRNLMFACIFLAVAGSWSYLAMPVLGPCYAFPELFDGARDELVRAAPTQRALAANYARMIEGRDGSLRQFNPYFGVAAMPSLHVGAHWLFALWARRHARKLFVPFAMATLLTFLGSLATGWHYAIDGYAGMLLAWAAVRLADRFEPVDAVEATSPSSGAEPNATAGDATATDASDPA